MIVVCVTHINIESLGRLSKKLIDFFSNIMMNYKRANLSTNSGYSSKMYWEQ